MFPNISCTNLSFVEHIPMLDWHWGIEAGMMASISWSSGLVYPSIFREENQNSEKPPAPSGITDIYTSYSDPACQAGFRENSAGPAKFIRENCSWPSSVCQRAACGWCCHLSAAVQSLSLTWNKAGGTVRITDHGVCVCVWQAAQDGIVLPLTAGLLIARQTGLGVFDWET